MKIWEKEPDRWDGEMMAMRRGPMGAWCGYVAIPNTHPLFGKDYSDAATAPADIVERPIDRDRISVVSLFCVDHEELADGHIPLDLCLEVHGGLTYADNHCPGDQPDGNWWFGFDCSHAGDLTPCTYERWGYAGDVYRDFEYAKAEVLSLARQLARWRQAA